MIIRELFLPTPQGPLDGKIVEAVGSLVDDDAPGREGNDAIHGPGAEAIRTGVDLRTAKPGARVVPFVRTLSRGAHGGDVIAVQRALQAAGFRKIRPSGVFGPVMAANVKAFKKAHDIRSTSSAPFTGVYDLATHHRLARFFDAYGAYLLMSEVKIQHAHKIRAGIVAAALFGVAHRDKIHYSQGPLRLAAIRAHVRPPQFPTETDCSGFGTWTYQVAGAPDPCGGGYDVRKLHWTGTMATHGTKVAKPQLGDLLLYGRAPDYEHVTIYIGNGRCVSHGSEPGPLVLPIHYRADFAMARSYV